MTYADDLVSSLLTTYIKDGMGGLLSPSAPRLKQILHWVSNLTIVDSMVFFSNWVFIPEPCCESILKGIHAGYLRKVKYIEKARQVLWWLGLTEDIKKVARSCRVYKEFLRVPREPLMPRSFHEQPW